MFSKKPVKKSAFDRYQDPTGEFSNRSLKFASWYVAHKILLRKVLIGVLSAWSVVTIGIGLYVWGKYVVYDYERDNNMLANIAESYIPFAVTRTQFSPKNLVLGADRIFNSAPERYDFVISVINPNDDWVAIPSYQFVYSGGQTDTYSSVVLPGEDRSLIAYGHKSERQPSGAQFKLVNIVWKRVDPHLVKDAETYIGQRIDFTVENVVFTAASQIDEGITNMIRFDVLNNSLFSYWEADFNVMYYDGPQLVGVSPLLITQMHGGERRTVDRSSFSPTMRVSSIELEPLINVFDSEEYMPLE